MDASFRCLDPYCFCVLNGIHKNESYPIGLSVCPTELELLYQLFVNVGIMIGIDENDWQQKCLLSDMGTALIAFANNNCQFHYFCHRHIYEFFGSNSALYCFVSKLLKCYSIEEYDDIRLDILL